jgi:hypothetical protein
MRSVLIGMVSALLIFSAACFAGLNGVGSLGFPADVSVRAKSNSSGRIRHHGGLRGGK